MAELDTVRLRDSQMDTVSLRNAFRTFTDAATFRRFAIQLRRDAPQNSQYGRPPERGLRYWQDELWLQFRAQLPAAPESIDAIRDAMLWCDLHEHSLVDGQGFLVSGVYETPGFVDALESQFPFGYGYWQLICPECVTACKTWIARYAPDAESEND